MHIIHISEIIIKPDRQRKEFESQSLVELADSIAFVGLIHPVVVNFVGNQVFLVAGERRLRALEILSMRGDSLYHGGKLIPEGQVPAVLFEELDSLSAMEVELEENIRRTDLTWQERSQAVSQLYELRRLQAEKRGEDAPTVASLAKEAHPSFTPEAASSAVKKELILARHLKDPEVAAAKSVDEGIKVIKRKEEAARSAALGESVGRTFSAKDHTLIHGDCLEVLPGLPDASFDVILSDPPYGIDAQDFNDSGGKAHAVGHTYDDSFDNWHDLMSRITPHLYRLAKPQAHLYLFCDIDNFSHLRSLVRDSGWQVFRTPIVWHVPTSQRTPWPHTGPMRRYQLCLYAVRGDRVVLKHAPDVVTYPNDQNLGWAAQKPVGLLSDFLSRSCRPGDRVLDPFCGSGSIFPAAHSLKIAATGVEKDPVGYGIAVKRLVDLK